MRPPAFLAALGVIIDSALSRILGIPRVAVAHRVVMRYGEAGGGLLARGLAFSILFALLPALLLIASVVGLIVRDPTVRAHVGASLAAQFPPLAPVLGQALDAALGAAPTVSILSILVLGWSASGMVRALDQAIRLVFRQPELSDGPLRAVVLTVGVAVAAVAVAGLLVALTVAGADAATVPLHLTAPTPLAILVGVAYRVLPRPRPSWRDVVPAAILVALAISVLTSFFAVLGPFLFGSAELYGAFAVLFLGIVWLGWSTELFLLGATWAADRAARRRSIDTPADTGSSGSAEQGTTL